MTKNIFTFWEPLDKVPGYLKFCIETWKKYCPEYTINILSYKDIFEYIDRKTYDFSTLKQFSLPIQADAIRAALLYKHGGLWLDYDTIIFSRQFIETFNNDAECSMIGNTKARTCHLAVISAKKGAKLLEYWVEQIQKRLTDEELLKTRDWSYLGNGIINSYTPQLNDKHLRCIDRNEFFFIEEKFKKTKQLPLSTEENYRYFWFENDFSDYIKDTPIQAALLHNSWTPAEIKKLSQKDFLHADCTCSKVFEKLLDCPAQKKTYYYSSIKKEYIDISVISDNDIYTLNIDGLQYKMFLPDKGDIDQRLIITNKKPREHEVLQAMRQFITDPAETQLIDIGHNCGNHTAYFAALGVDVFAFDPNKHLSKILEKTLSINDFKNVRIYNTGLSDKTFTTSFRKINPAHTGSMSLETQKQTLCDISVTLLDALSIDFANKKTLVKIDVEGMEIDVLRGMSETLAKLDPVALFIEIHTLTELKNIADFLSSYGYIMDQVLECHTCKFIKKTQEDSMLFFSEQRFLIQEVFGLFKNIIGTTIPALRNELSWKMILLDPSFILPPEITPSSDLSRNYLQFYIKGISSAIHYELLNTARGLTYCLHCEEAGLVPLYREAFYSIAQRLNRQCTEIPNTKLGINIETTLNTCRKDLQQFIYQSLGDLIKIGK